MPDDLRVPIAFQEMESARQEAAAILQSPGADLDRLKRSLEAQREHVAQLRVVCAVANQDLTSKRREKDGLLELMPPCSPNI